VRAHIRRRIRRRGQHKARGAKTKRRLPPALHIRPRIITFADCCLANDGAGLFARQRCRLPAAWRRIPAAALAASAATCFHYLRLLNIDAWCGAVARAPSISQCNDNIGGSGCIAFVCRISISFSAALATYTATLHRPAPRHAPAHLPCRAAARMPAARLRPACHGDDGIVGGMDVVDGQITDACTHNGVGTIWLLPADWCGRTC